MITQGAYKPSSSYKGTAKHTEQLLQKTAEKALDKIQQPPMIKILNQVGKVDLHVSPETLKLLEENLVCSLTSVLAIFWGVSS